MNKPLISILIANYNNGRYFGECFQSILEQDLTAWEIIVVDDGSTDNSLEIIEDIVGDDPRVFVYKNDENFGCGYTKNRCAALATADISTFIDPDDAIKSGALSALVKAHNENPEVVLVHSVYDVCDEKLNFINVYEFAGPVEVDKYFTNLDGRVIALFAFKNFYYNKTEGIDKTLIRAVEQDLYLKLAETGPFLFLNERLYRYRIHSKGVCSENPERALYSFIKALVRAEERRGVSLEEVIHPYFNGITVKDVYQKAFEVIEKNYQLKRRFKGLIVNAIKSLKTFF